MTEKLDMTTYQNKVKLLEDEIQNKVKLLEDEIAVLQQQLRELKAQKPIEDHSDIIKRLKEISELVVKEEQNTFRYFMRDNHIFVLLSKNKELALEQIRLEHEINSYGYLCRVPVYSGLNLGEMTWETLQPKVIEWLENTGKM